MPAANTQYRTGSTQHHREFCGDYLPKSTFHNGVNISPKQHIAKITRRNIQLSNKLNREHKKIKLQYSILPEYTEFQPSVQQLKKKSAQQFYNFTSFTNATIHILKSLQHILYCTFSILFTILKLSGQSTSTSVIGVQNS